MVCDRCIKVVKDEFEKLNLLITSIELGEVKVENTIDETKIIEVQKVLEANGFELIDDKKRQLIEGIKTLIIEDVHHGKDTDKNANYSALISKAFGYDYSYLSNLFSSEEGVTIEKYIIHQKIEKGKELLAYNELSIKEIAFSLGYSSVQHFSNQFKKITNFTPSQFKMNGLNKRRPLDSI